MRTRGTSRRTRSISKRSRRLSGRTLAVVLASIGCALLLTAAFHASAATPTAQAHVASAITPPPLPNSFPALHPVAVTGIPAIQHSGGAILAQQDVATYVQQHLIPPRFQASGTPSLTHTMPMTNAQLGALLREDTGLPDNGQYFYVELHGEFSVLTSNQQVLSFPIAYEVFDAQTGDLLMEGLLPQPPTPPTSPTATPVSTKPTATPTKQVTPVINVSISPSSTKQACNGTGALPGWTLTIDNTKSNVAESWTISISDKEPNSTTVWATASAYSGTAKAGGKSTVTITPASDICSKIGYSGPPFIGNVKVTWPISGGSQFVTVPDTINGPIIG